jgi:hypothetical protein
MLYRICSSVKFAVAALMVCFTGVEARGPGHLIPIEPIFDPNGRYAATYARLCEEKLFTGSSWMIRYHFVSKAEIGLSITKDHDRKYWLTVKQAKPTLEYVVTNAYRKYLNWDLKSALKTVEFQEARAEIPAATVTAIRDFWISLLNDVRPPSAVSRDKTLVLGTKVILSEKAPDGRILQGELPSDADRHPPLNAVEEIVDDLLSVCAKPGKPHDVLFKRVEQKALQATKP